MIGVRGVGTGAVMVTCGLLGLAYAQPTTSPPVPDARSAPEPAEPRGGLALLGGVISADDRAWRVDAFTPIPNTALPRLRLGLEVIYSHAKLETPILGVDAYGFLFTPTASYDWRLPISSRLGEFVIQAEGGIGAGLGRIKIDEPYMPGRFDNVFVSTMRIAAAGQFRGYRGLLVSLQPFGLDVPLNHPKSPRPSYHITTGIAYEVAFLAGYQFR